MVFPNLRLLSDIDINAVIFAAARRVFYVHLKNVRNDMFIAQIKGNRAIYIINEAAVHEAQYGGKVYKFLYYRLGESHPISLPGHKITEYQRINHTPVTPAMLETMRILVKGNIQDEDIPVDEAIAQLTPEAAGSPIQVALQHLSDHNVKLIPKARDGVVLAAENDLASKVVLDNGMTTLVDEIASKSYKDKGLVNKEKIPRFSMIIFGFMGFISTFIGGMGYWWFFT